MLEAVFFKLSWPIRDAPVSGLLIQRFLAVALISIGPGFFCAFGEELGWRGRWRTLLSMRLSRVSSACLSWERALGF